MEFRVSIHMPSGDERQRRRRPAVPGKKVIEGLRRAFPQCRCKRDGNSVSLFSSSGSVAEDVIAYMKKRGPEFRIIQNDLWTGDDISRARWVELCAKVGPVDANDAWEPLNSFPDILCTECGHYNERAIPEPYYVSRALLGKKDEIFSALNGLIVVNARVKELILDVAGKQVACGEARLVGGTGQATKRADRGKHYWIQPKFSVG